MGWLIWAARIIPALFLLFCFLTAPNLIHRKLNCRQLTGWDYAHRGLYSNTRGIPENSLPAFSAAVREGYGIELDVRLTADQVPVVHHDDTLERTCGDARRVDETYLKDIRSLKLFGTQCSVPTFDEVLELVNGQVPLIIELKTDSRKRKLAELVYERLQEYPGVYCIESFDPFAVQWFRRNAPDVTRGQLSFMDTLKGKSFREATKRILLGCLFVNSFSRPDFIAYGFKTDANIAYRFVSNVFRPILAAWTVQDVESSRKLREEYDIQIFENFRPDQAYKVRETDRRKEK